MSRLVFETQTQFSRGQNSSAALANVLQDEVRRLQDARVSMEGSFIEPRGGSKRTHTTALNAGSGGLGGIEFTTAAGQQQLVVFAGSQMHYSINGGTGWTQGATGLGTSNYWSLVVMRQGSTNYLFAANGSNLYSWDGTTWATVTGTGVPSTAKYLAVFNDRLYAAGHNGIEVYASRVGDVTGATAWDTTAGAFTVQIQTHDNDIDITGLYTLGTSLLVFKRGSFGFIEGFGSQSVFVQVGARGLSRSVGCVAFRSIRAVGDDGICFLSERGLEFFAPGRGQPVNVTSAMQDYVERIAWDTIDSNPGLPCAVYWPLKREYQLALPLDGGTSNNARLVWRPPQEQNPVAMLAQFTSTVLASDQGTLSLDGDNYLVLLTGEGGYDLNLDANGYLILDAAAGDKLGLTNGYLTSFTPDYPIQVLFTADRGTEFSRPYAVGDDGFVRELEQGTSDDVLSNDTGGTPVNASVLFRPFTFGAEFYQKSARKLRVKGQSDAGATATMVLYSNAAATSGATLTFPSGAGPVLASQRVGGKGLHHQVELIWSGDLKVQAVELGMQPLRRGS